MESEPAEGGRRALAAAEKATGSHGLSVSQYLAARDYLLVALTRSIGTRPGALECATIGQFHAARWDNQK